VQLRTLFPAALKNPPMKPSGFLLASVRAAIPSLICISGTASAQLYWDTDGATPGSATSSTPIWGTSSSWTTDITGSSATTAYIEGSDVVISAGGNGTGAFTLKVNGTRSANSLTFEEGTVTMSATDTGGNVSTGAASLSIGAGGLTMVNGLHGELFLGASMGNITLSASQSWLNNTITDAILGTAVRNLRIASNVVGSATTGNTITWTIGGNGTINNDGLIGNGSAGGTLALTKTGAGTLTLFGALANTYTGLTTVSGGTLTLGKTAGVTAIVGNLQVNSGTLIWTANNQVNDSSTLTVSGGAANFNGRDETLATATIGGGTISTGSGKAIVSGTTTLTTGGASRLTVNSGGAYTTDALVMGGTSFGIGATTGGNILIGGNSSTVSNLNIGPSGLTMTGQVIQFNKTNSGMAGSELNLNGNFTGSGANIIDYGTTGDLFKSALNLGTATRTFDITGGTTTIGVPVSGTGAGITKTGLGTLILSGANTYTGNTNVNTGILNIRHAQALGTTAGETVVGAGATLQLQGGITVANEKLTLTSVNSGVANTAALINVSGDNVWTGNIDVDLTNNENARMSMTAGTLLISGNVNLSAAAATFGLVLTGNGGTGTISGVISGTGANQNVLKNGTSTWVLTGTNTYNGITRIDAGTLSVSSIANNLGPGTSAINLGEGPATGTLLYTGSGETVARGFVLRSNHATPGGGVIDQSGTGELLISGAFSSNATTAGKSLTLQGSSSGTGRITGNIANGTGTPTSIVKSGTGKWTLSGTAKSYTGSTTVTGGELNISTSLTSTSAINITNGKVTLESADLINNAATVTLGTNATLVTAIGSETVGALLVNGNSILDLTPGSSLINFANSKSQDWTGGLLTVLGWNGNEAGGGVERVIFGNDSTGLTSDQLTQVQFSRIDGFYSARILATGEIVPDALIPEASSAALLMLGGTGMLLRRKRREAGC
jgi:fibronectin-binding autotransporter adhesin